MSHPLPISLPDSVYDCIEKAAHLKNQSVKDYMIDSAMLAASGKTKTQYLEDIKVAKIKGEM
jgi:uncharacterized protein (DUF1778 family)